MSYQTGAKHILLLILFLSHFETSADVQCRRIFKSKESGPIKSGSQILHEIDPKLHTRAAVERVARVYRRKNGPLQKPIDKLSQWLLQLEKLVNRAGARPRTLDRLKKTIYHHYVIKDSEIPDSYYARQSRLARERGHGTIEWTESLKRTQAENVINDQKHSLDIWIDYLSSQDTKMYPPWIKYWIFNGISKLASFNFENGEFTMRDKGTVAPFPQLNHEALSLSIDAFLRYINRTSIEEMAEAPDSLLASLNFGKIYGRFLFLLGRQKNSVFSTNEGQWIHYKQGQDHLPLVKSLQGRNTGWCTAGESTAKLQLGGGDMYIYYSLDDKGAPVLPRVAIRMENDEIAEVRGIAENQNFDSQISQSSVVSNKLKEFGEKADRFFKRDKDMKTLTRIESKHKEKLSLSREELQFLYELDSKIEGFGYEKDPRIDEIRMERDIRSDLVIAFDNKYTRDEISITREQALNGKTKVHFGDLDLKHLTRTEGLILPETVFGSVDLGPLTSIKNIILPKYMMGYGFLDLASLTSPEGLILPLEIRGNLILQNLTSAKGLLFPRRIEGDLYLNSLTTAEGLILPENITGSLAMESLKSSQGLILPLFIGAYLSLDGLESVKGLKRPAGIQYNIGPNDFDP